MEFMVFNLSNGKYLKDIESIDDESCAGFSITDDIHEAHIFRSLEYNNISDYFDIFSGSFTKFKITEA
jgi:hypothetical protein